MNFDSYLIDKDEYYENLQINKGDKIVVFGYPIFDKEKKGH